MADMGVESALSIRHTDLKQLQPHPFQQLRIDLIRIISFFSDNERHSDDTAQPSKIKQQYQEDISNYRASLQFNSVSSVVNSESTYSTCS